MFAVVAHAILAWWHGAGLRPRSIWVQAFRTDAPASHAVHARVRLTSGTVHLADDWLAAQYRKAAEVLDVQVFAGHPSAPVGAE